MLRKTIFLGLFLYLPLISFSQGQTSNWYFGEGAGLYFNPDGSISPLADGQISTFEGCATISDDSGQLLFYTDGIEVFNSKHEIMDNGFGLLGDPSSTQSAIIVPKPEDPDIYYIFTMDTSTSQRDPDLGMHYTIVDMSLNKGLGDVTTKNVNLLQRSSEKLAAVIKDCFDRSIWVITLGPGEVNSLFYDTIYAFEVSTAGVNPVPVKTSLAGLEIRDARGYLKLSPDGAILASANQNSGLFLFDFDIASGSVSGYSEIRIPGSNTNPYGLEFSPDGRYLYVHSSNEAIPQNPIYTSSLLQYDLQQADIENSMVVLDERPIFRGALQLGENGKIYRTLSNNYFRGTSYLGVIHNPNAGGLSADYQHNAIDLGSKITNQGLPPFVQSFFNRNELIKNEDGSFTNIKEVCEGNAFTLEAEDLPGALYIWEKDGVAQPGITGYQHTVPNSDPADSGTYKVEIIPADPSQCPILGQSYIKVLPKPSASLSYMQCDYDIGLTDDGITRIDLMAIIAGLDLEFEFFISPQDRDLGTPISDPQDFQNTVPFVQTVYYRATNSLGCRDDGQLDLTVVPGDITPSALGAVYSCDEDATDNVMTGTFNMTHLASYFPDLNVSFYSTIEDLAREENELTDIFTSEPTSIFARKNNETQCLGVEILELIVETAPTLEMESQYALCSESGQVVLRAPGSFDQFTWYQAIGGEKQIISNDPQIILDTEGDYLLEALISQPIRGLETGCVQQASFSVTNSQIAQIEGIEIEDFSANNKVTILVNGAGLYEYSLDGNIYQESNLFDQVEPGIMTVYVRDKNGCGVARQEITVLGYPKFFTPNGDGVNDFWQLTGVNDEFESDALIMIYDRYGSMVAQISPSGQGWSGKSNAQLFPASDYWFRVILRSGQEFKGHFALKR